MLRIKSLGNNPATMTAMASESLEKYHFRALFQYFSNLGEKRYMTTKELESVMKKLFQFSKGGILNIARHGVPGIFELVRGFPKFKVSPVL